MLIKKVHVQGFGALENASFSFGPGVNLIYGPNEAGKSTLQYFIYGLLYGLRKKTSSTLTDEAKLYQPWRGTQFGGSMEFSVAGEEYLLLRDFASGGAAQLFCGRTGEDLTRNFPVDPKNGELLFASELLGLSELAFRNITYIGQLASRCQRELAGELAGKLANLSTAGEEDVSLRRAQEALTRALDQLGTMRPSNKPLGKLVRRARELEKRERELAANLKGLWQEQRKAAALADKLVQLNQEYEKALARQRQIEASLLAQRLERIRHLERELKTIREELAQKAGADFPLKLIGRGRALEERVGLYGAEEEKLAEEQRRLEEELALVAAEAETIEEKREKVCAVLTMPPDLFASSLEQDEKILSERKAQLKQEETEVPKGGSSSFAAVLAAAAASLVLSLFQPLFLLPLGILGYFAFLLYRRRRRIAERRIQLAQKARELEEEEKRLQEEFARLDNLLDLPGKAGLAAWQREGERLSGLRSRQTFLEERLADLRRRLAENRELIAQTASQIQALFGELGVESWAEFWQQADLSEERQKLKAEEGRLAGELKLALAGEELESLEARFAELEKAGLEEAASQADWEEVSRHLRQLELARQEKKNELSRLEGLLAGAEGNSLAVISASRAQLEERIHSLAQRREALEYAKEVLSECAKQLHRQFAPQLAGEVSRNFAKLTAGRYRQVLVSENLQLRVEDSAANLFTADSLSGGSLDQLYFALRVALSRLVCKEGVYPPFLLDDSFVQYDEARAKEGWQLLRELAAENQIIYFTCHRQQLSLAGDNVNLIDLSAERKEAVCS